MKRTGFIAIVGRPNVGKSTLMNRILGEKVAIVSSKPQTTRNRIIGIHTVGEDQYVFLDTPGIHQPKNSLGDFMVKAANDSMHDADAVVLVVDAGKEITKVEENVMEYVKKSGVPAILALNKVDLYTRDVIAQTITAYASKSVTINGKNKGTQYPVEDGGENAEENDEAQESTGTKTLDINVTSGTVNIKTK